jgi:6,7-dimethyl-8-ribityllumazine synthase
MKPNMNILLVCSPYYKSICENLIKGAVDLLKSKSIKYVLIFVPGALEIPAAIKYSSLKEYFDGYIALGCIIRGETYHFEIVSNEAANGLTKLALDYNLPIGNGILTVENEKQALVRSDPKKYNKGEGAALACISLINIKNN